jgi:hypothetical protein
LSDYARAKVERDVRELADTGDLETFERFLRLCAGRIGKLSNYSALAADCGIAVDQRAKRAGHFSPSLVWGLVGRGMAVTKRAQVIRPKSK